MDGCPDPSSKRAAWLTSLPDWAVWSGLQWIVLMALQCRHSRKTVLSQACMGGVKLEYDRCVCVQSPMVAITTYIRDMLWKSSSEFYLSKWKQLATNQDTVRDYTSKTHFNTIWAKCIQLTPAVTISINYSEVTEIVSLMRYYLESRMHHD